MSRNEKTRMTAGRQPPGMPCAKCSHEFRQHDFLHTEPGTGIGRYRCTVRDCFCGQQYEPIVVRLSGDETEAQREAVMLTMAAAHDARSRPQ